MAMDRQAGRAAGHPIAKHRMLVDALQGYGGNDHAIGGVAVIQRELEAA